MDPSKKNKQTNKPNKQNLSLTYSFLPSHFNEDVDESSIVLQ